MDLESFSLDDSFEVFAHWWLPESPNDRVPGNLDFSPEKGAILTLQGTFNHPAFEFRNLLSQTAFETERIYGEQPDGKRFTALRAFAFQIGSTCSIRCHLVLAGAHVGIEEEKLPATVLFSYDNLEEWAWAPPLRAENSHSSERTSYSYENEPVYIVVLPNNQIEHGLTLTTYVTGRLSRLEARFERKTQFRAIFQAVDIQSILKFLADVGQLLTVFMGEPAHVRAIRCCIGAEVVKIFFERSRPPTRRNSPMNIDMPFSHRDLGQKSASFFSSWLGSIERMRPVYSTFFSTLFNDAAYLDTKFQSLAQSLEGFHRRTCEGKYLTTEEYSAVEDHLARSLPPEMDPGLKGHLRAAIKYGNEFSLRKRLRELIENLVPATREVLCIDSCFISEVVEARNYYAHLDETIKPQTVGNGKALYYLNERLSALFMILLLKHLGMDEAEARQGVIKRRKFFE